MFSERVRMVWVRQYRGIGGLVRSIFFTSQPADQLTCDEPDHPADFANLLPLSIEPALRLPGYKRLDENDRMVWLRQDRGVGG